ncbi:MAG: lipopolysaccharide biosynthesis protein [Oscillospiraceae bacterium]|nr:lipopolysaccharide biosynthesis protein [Oscillospiraceae bacterium]
MEKDLNKKVGQATKWSSITEIAAKLVSPITNMILARLLVPEAFGVVATLTMVVSFAEIFTDAGFQKYLVQRQFEDDDDLNQSTNVAFWTNLCLSVLIWIGIACFATPIANLVGSPGAELAIIVMSLQIPVLAFSSIQMARYRRDFDFKTLFVVRMCTTAVPLVVTVPLALVFRSYWALVIGTLMRDIVNAAILTVRSKWKPRFYFNFAKLKQMLSFSMWTVVENISIWLTSYIGTFIVGQALNAYYLGLYKTTISTTGSYFALVTSATTPVLFSALSRCQNDPTGFKDTFFRFQRMVAMLVFPLGFGIFVYRELAVSILLGQQWMETADFFGLWSLTSAITIIFSHYNSEVFRSMGKPKLSVLVQVLHLAALVPLLLWSMDKGFTVLTVTRSLVRFQMILVSMIAVWFVAKISFLKVLKNVWPSLVAATVMAAAGMCLRTVIDSIIWEIATVLICVVIYAGVMMLLPAGRKQLAEVPILRKVFHLKEGEQENANTEC